MDPICKILRKGSSQEKIVSRTFCSLFPIRCLTVVELLNFLCIWILNGAHSDSTRSCEEIETWRYDLIEKKIIEILKLGFGRTLQGDVPIIILFTRRQRQLGWDWFLKKIVKIIAEVVNFLIAKYLNWVCHNKSGSLKNQSHF